MPSGAAWARDEAADTTRLLDGIAEEFARIDARASALPSEANPQTTLDLLPDWERVAGLPDPCVGQVADNVQARRLALTSKLAGSGSASIPYFIAVGAKLGYEITIREHRPFRAGAAVAGDALTNDDWQFTWRVKGPATAVTYFCAG